MKKGFRLIASVTLVAAFVTTIPALCIGSTPPSEVEGTNPWKPIGLDGANVLTVTVDSRTPATVYAGTEASGVLKSLDGGTSWTLVNRGLTTLHVPVMAIDPTQTSTLYAGTDDSVFKSTDAGENWAASKIGPDGVMTAVYALAIDPSRQPRCTRQRPRGSTSRSMPRRAGHR